MRIMISSSCSEVFLTELIWFGNQEKDKLQETGVWDVDADNLQSGWDPQEIARAALRAKRDALKREMVEVEKELHNI